MGVAPWWVTLPIQGLTAYALFTPMHDASHGSVSRRKWVNEVVGRVCSLVLTAPFGAFRWAHLLHHKHTNEADHDPDHWTGAGPWWQLPLRWATLDLHYYVFYATHWSERPVRERVETVATVAGLVAVLTGLAMSGWGLEVLLCWVLPARFAITALAFLFDYLPHHPHEITSSEDRYRATHNFRELWLTPVLLYQNYHLLHHLQPGVPFYRYAAVWRARKERFEARGASTRSVFTGLWPFNGASDVVAEGELRPDANCSSQQL